MKGDVIMKNELVTKEVEFNGDLLKAVQDVSSNKIYVGISWVCNGIGLNKSQKDTQVQKIQSDIVLKQGCLKFQAGVFDDNNDTLSIELNYLPLWLAKISITPTMIKENPEVTQKLINYQLQAKDVLVKAFIHSEKIDIDNFHIPTTLSEALLLSANLAKENEIMKPKADQFDLYLQSKGLLSMNQSSKELKARRNKFMEFLRHMKVFNQDNSPAEKYSSVGYFEVKNYVIIRKNDKKYSMAVTYVTPNGQNFLYRYLNKHKDIYAKYDKKYLKRIGRSEVQANA
jgi:phage antirepressor YoqD-like protein